jgi:transposase
MALPKTCFKLRTGIMRYELSDYEWTAINPILPDKPRGVRRANDRRVLNGIFWAPRSGAPPPLAAVLEENAEAKLRLCRIERCDPGERLFSADESLSGRRRPRRETFIRRAARATFSHKGRRNEDDRMAFCQRKNHLWLRRHATLKYSDETP